MELALAGFALLTSGILIIGLNHDNMGLGLMALFLGLAFYGTGMSKSSAELTQPESSPADSIRIEQVSDIPFDSLKVANFDFAIDSP